MKKILLIDDDRFLLQMYKKKFEETDNYKVFTIEVLDPDYITQIAELAPDLIISDNVRPGPDGIETLRRLKKDPRTQNIPFIFLSNSITGELIRESKRLGVAGVISKGDTIPQEVVDEVTKILANL